MEDGKLPNFDIEGIRETAEYQRMFQDLRRAAKIISKILQKDDNLQQDSSMSNKELKMHSKTTKRNSQYQSMALNLIWYIAYQLTYKKAPPCVDFESQNNDKKAKYTDFYDKKKESVSTQKKIANLKSKLFLEIGIKYKENVNSLDDSTFIEILKKEQRQIKLLAKFTDDGKAILPEGLKTNLYEHKSKKNRGVSTILFLNESIKRLENTEPIYTYNMVNSVYKNMERLVSYFKKMYDTLYNKKCSCSIDKNGTKNSGTAAVLEEEIRDLRIELKFLGGILLELDIEIVTSKILKDLSSAYYPLPTKSLLKLVAEKLGKFCCNALEFPSELAKIDNDIKEAKYESVAKQLHSWAVYAKYRRIKEDNEISLPKAKDISDFKTYSKNINSIHGYVSRFPLTFNTVNNDTNYGNLLYMTFTQNSQIKIFDAITIPNKNLKNMSWSDRLNAFQLFVTKYDIGDFNLIKVEEIPYINIQFSMLNRGDEYLYIRTAGTGEGTLFVHTLNKKKPGHSSHIRYPKITPDDLKIVQIKAVYHEMVQIQHVSLSDCEMTQYRDDKPYEVQSLLVNNMVCSPMLTELDVLTPKIELIEETHDYADFS